MHLDLGKLCFQIVAGEFPLEEASGGAVLVVVVVLEAQQMIFEFGPGLKIAKGEEFALNDREVHLDLFEAAGMCGCMHWDDRGPASFASF